MCRLLVVDRGKGCECLIGSDLKSFLHYDDFPFAEACQHGSSVREALPADVTAAFVAQCSLATLKGLIAIGEAANDEKDRRLMADVEPGSVSTLVQRPDQAFAAPEPDLSGAGVDVIRRVFVAQCEADGRAETVYDMCSAPIGAGTARTVLRLLGLSALLEPEAGSEEDVEAEVLRQTAREGKEACHE